MSSVFFEKILNPNSAEIEYFVENVWGPIVHYYIWKLDLTLRVITQKRKAKVLFCFRSGIRILDLMITYYKSAEKDIDFDFDLFKISRFIALKILLYRNKKLGSYFANLYYPNPIELYTALTGKKKHITSYNDIYDDEEIYSILKHEHDKFNYYINNIAQGYKDLILVDEGWKGGIHIPLSLSYSKWNFITLYFGKMKLYELPKAQNKQSNNIFGIIFESDDDKYDPQKLETCFLLHKHWVESFFEPSDIPSIKRIDEGSQVNISEVLEKANNHKDYVDNIYTLTKKYIENFAKYPISKILKRYNEALKDINRMIIYPDIVDVKLLKGKFRHHDMGRVGGLYTLVPPYNRFPGDNPERRISESLWPFGQATLEYIDDVILRRTIQDELLKRVSKTHESKYFSEHIEKINSQIDRKIFQEEIKYDPKRKTAIIMRTKDRPILLKRAIESVASQTLKNYELIIVNDGGKISNVINAIKSSYIDPSRIIIISHAKSRGMEAASNAGINASESKYIAIHDDDDMWKPEFLQKTVEFLELYSDKYKGVITKSFYISEKVHLSGEIEEIYRIPFHDWVSRLPLAEILIQNLFPPIAFLYHRDMWKLLGGYDESLPVLGDWDFNIRFLVEANIGIINEYLAEYRVREDPGSLYLSSLSAGRTLHNEYYAILRNKYLRLAEKNSKYLALSILMNIAYNQEDIRRRINSILEGLK